MKNKMNVIPPSTRVEIYFNLHKKCLSVRHKGLVVAHAAHVEMDNATFAVSQAGRARVLRENRKNVHAFIRGNLVSFTPLGTDVNNGDTANVTYNPYKYDSFVRIVDQSRITAAQKVFAFGRKIVAVE
jgi:hypothetical protein